MKKRKIIFSVVISVIILLLIGTIILINNKSNSKEIASTGHFYGKPSSVKEIESIEVVYNNGKDYISILGGRYEKNKILYYTYDKNGNMIDNHIDADTSDIFKYVYEKDLKYLKKYEHVDNEKWSLKVSAPGMHCLISSKKAEPKWFNKLLKKLNVEENGYLSNKE